jgi:soluble lytic murein transglycosylase-like protein
MVGQIDEPIAISKAISGMVRSVNQNNRTLKEVNNDLIASLTALKLTIQSSFAAARSETAKEKSKAKPAEIQRVVAPSDSAAILNKISNTLLTQNLLLTKYLGDVPYLTSATRMDEKDKWQTTVIDWLKAIASNEKCCLPFGVRPGIRPGVNPGVNSPLKNKVLKEGETLAEGGAEVAAGVEAENLLHKQKVSRLTSAINSLKGAPKAALRKGGGVVRDVAGVAASSVGNALKSLGTLGGAARGIGLAGGALGTYGVYNSTKDIGPIDQSKGFLTGTNGGFGGSTASKYLDAGESGAVGGASLGMMFGPQGALIGAAVGGAAGIGAALYKQYSPQIDAFIGVATDKVGDIVKGIYDFISSKLPSWDSIKSALGEGVALIGSGFNSAVSAIGTGITAIGNFPSQLAKWQDEGISWVGNWIGEHLPSWDKIKSTATGLIDKGLDVRKSVSDWIGTFTTGIVNSVVSMLPDWAKLSQKHVDDIKTFGKSVEDKINAWQDSILSGMNSWLHGVIYGKPKDSSTTNTASAVPTPPVVIPTSPASTASKSASYFQSVMQGFHKLKNATSTEFSGMAADYNNRLSANMADALIPKADRYNPDKLEDDKPKDDKGSKTEKLAETAKKAEIVASQDLSQAGKDAAQALKDMSEQAKKSLEDFKMNSGMAAQIYGYGTSGKESGFSYSSDAGGVVQNRGANYSHTSGPPVPTDVAAYAMKQAKADGLDPAYIKAILQQEGGGYNNESYAGAWGPMQLMPGTAQDMGVKDIHDWHQNVEGGLKYYKQNLDLFKKQSYVKDASGKMVYDADLNNRLAAAAYNAGPGNSGVKYMAASGGDTGFLPDQTNGYVRNTARNAALNRAQMDRAGPIPVTITNNPSDPASALASRHDDPAKQTLSPTQAAGISNASYGAMGASKMPDIHAVPLYMNSAGLIIVNNSALH